MRSHRAYEEGALGCGEGPAWPPSGGSEHLLSAKEEQAMQWLIQDRTPDQLKMNDAL